MRPLTLVLTAVVAVAGAYAVVYWRNASDVREQLEVEQAAARSGVPQFDPIENGSQGDYVPRLSQPSGTRPPGEPGMPPPKAEDEESGTESVEAAGEVTASDMPAQENEGVSTDFVAEQIAEKKEENYASLQQTATRIATDIQRQMRRGEILTRGQRVGAAFLRFMGYAVNDRGEHETLDGTFSIDVRGPDLVVVSGVSQEFGNQLEVSIIGPRDVDRRVRRLQ